MAKHYRNYCKHYKHYKIKFNETTPHDWHFFSHPTTQESMYFLFEPVHAYPRILGLETLDSACRDWNILFIANRFKECCHPRQWVRRVTGSVSGSGAAAGGPAHVILIVADTLLLSP